MVLRTMIKDGATEENIEFMKNKMMAEVKKIEKYEEEKMTKS